ncbi:MAG: hypothetical protein LBU00_06985 [Treponema sp.]|jgi:hypothetical protein|nr:hypothetical protein [Treponema sp.]
MIRVEIIANHSVEENILEAFAREGVGKFYTKYPNVFGIGNSGPRMGDAVWPEENLALVVWCEEDEARGIAHAVDEVKKQFPDEGIRVFGLPGQQTRFAPAFQPSQDSVFTQPEGPPSPAPVSSAAPYPATPYPAAPYTPPQDTPGAAPQVSWPQVEPISPPPQVSAHVPPVYSSPPVYTATELSGITTEYDGQNMDEEH